LEIDPSDIGEIYPAIVDRHGKKRVHQTKFTAEINLKAHQEAKWILLDQGTLDIKYDWANFKKISHPNEFMKPEWQDLVNYKLILDVDNEQLKTKEELELE